MVKPSPILGALVGVAHALAGAPSAVAEELTLRVPAYHPRIGEERVYRIEIETRADSHGLITLGEKSQKGEFTNRLTVLEASPVGFKMRWRLQPKDAGAGPRALNEIYRDRIEVFGSDTIEVETDRRGAATKIDNLDALRKGVESRIASLAADDPARGRLQALLQRLQPGSLFPMEALAPAADRFAAAQADVEREVDLGAPRTSNAEARINEASVPFKLTTRFDVDKTPGFVTLTWTRTYDEDALTDAWREVIDSETKDLATRRPDTPKEKLAEYSRASQTITTKVRLSLDDGSAIDAEEIAESRTGPVFTKSVFRATRE